MLFLQILRVVLQNSRSISVSLMSELWFHGKIWTVNSCKIPVKESIISKDIGLKPATLLNIVP